MIFVWSYVAIGLGVFLWYELSGTLESQLANLKSIDFETDRLYRSSKAFRAFALFTLLVTVVIGWPFCIIIQVEKRK